MLLVLTVYAMIAIGLAVIAITDHEWARRRAEYGYVVRVLDGCDPVAVARCHRAGHPRLRSRGPPELLVRAAGMA